MDDRAPQVVITGAALITCLGATRDETWQAVREGRCGMGAMPALEQPIPDGHTGGQAVDLPENFAPELPREARYLRRAILDAITDAGLDIHGTDWPYEPPRCGVLLGTTLHGMRAAGRFLRTENAAPLADFL